MSTNEVAYTSNLLGTIKALLAGLQGYDVMALELIQNADDAGATEIIFNITDQALVVRNNRKFTYCGQIKENPCPQQIACDFHAILNVASGEKLAIREKIGRFGIGFLSTYQITDCPEIHSNGLEVKLQPEEGRGKFQPSEETNGTQFVLPWASDKNSLARRKLNLSHITKDHIEQLIKDFQQVLPGPRACTGGKRDRIGGLPRDY